MRSIFFSFFVFCFGFFFSFLFFGFWFWFFWFWYLLHVCFWRVPKNGLHNRTICNTWRRGKSKNQDEQIKIIKLNEKPKKKEEKKNRKKIHQHQAPTHNICENCLNWTIEDDSLSSFTIHCYLFTPCTVFRHSCVMHTIRDYYRTALPKTLQKKERKNSLFSFFSRFFWNLRMNFRHI